MKKLINSPELAVRESLDGLAQAHHDLLSVDLELLTVRRKDAPVSGKVGIVSGGGSGHEPLHTGFVGPGMLDAACAGEIFTSPVPDQMLAATRAVDGGAGVLHIVKNYTCDATTAMSIVLPVPMLACSIARLWRSMGFGSFRLASEHFWSA